MLKGPLFLLLCDVFFEGVRTFQCAFRKWSSVVVRSAISILLLMFDGGHVVGLVLLSGWAKRRLSMVWSFNQRDAHRHNRFNRGITFDFGGRFMHRCQPTSGECCGVLKRQHCVKVRLSGGCVHHQDAMMLREMQSHHIFCISWWLRFSCHFDSGCGGGALLFFSFGLFVKQFIRTSYALDFTGHRWVLFCESLVRNGHFWHFVFQWDAVGICRFVVRLFRGVFGASVVAVEDQLCMQGFGLSSFCEEILVSSRFCLSIDDVVWSWGFFEKTVSQMVSPEPLVVSFWHHFRGLKRCVPVSVCFDGWTCLFLRGLHRILVCCDWVHATHKLYSDFSFHCCCRGRGSCCEHVGCWSLCISANFGNFISDCFSNVAGSHHEHIMLMCVCVCFTSGFVIHVLFTEESLCLNSVALTNFQNTWCSCFLLVVMIIRLFPQSGACFGAKLKSMRRTLWQSGGSRHLCWRRWPFICRFSIVSLFPRSCCEEVCSWASHWLFILQFKESPSWGCGFRKLRLVPQF